MEKPIGKDLPKDIEVSMGEKLLSAFPSLSDCAESPNSEAFIEHFMEYIEPIPLQELYTAFGEAFRLPEIIVFRLGVHSLLNSHIRFRNNNMRAWIRKPIETGIFLLDEVVELLFLGFPLFDSQGGMQGYRQEFVDIFYGREAVFQSEAPDDMDYYEQKSTYKLLIDTPAQICVPWYKDKDYNKTTMEEVMGVIYDYDLEKGRHYDKGKILNLYTGEFEYLNGRETGFKVCYRCGGIHDYRYSEEYQCYNCTHSRFWGVGPYD